MFLIFDVLPQFKTDNKFLESYHISPELTAGLSVQDYQEASKSSTGRDIMFLLVTAVILQQASEK